MNFQTNQLFPPDLQMFRSIHAWSALLRVVVEIQRKAESVTLNRSQRQGVKAREIYQRYPKAKADGLIKSLRSRGLWYWDPDFGDDEEDHLLLLLFILFIDGLNYGSTLHVDTAWVCQLHTCQTCPCYIHYLKSGRYMVCQLT